MGLNYSFLIVSPVGQVNDVLSGLAGIAAPDSAARLRAALPWVPNQVIETWSARRSAFIELKLDAKGLAPRDNCLVLRFPHDGVVSAYEPGELRWWQFWKRRHVPAEVSVEIGCIDLTIRAGSSLAGVWLTAVTSDMSRLFVESASIRRTLTEVASSGRALSLLLDLEDDYELVSPAGNRFNPEYESFLVNEDLYEVDIDLFLEAVLARRTPVEAAN